MRCKANNQDATQGMDGVSWDSMEPLFGPYRKYEKLDLGSGEVEGFISNNSCFLFLEDPPLRGGSHICKQHACNVPSLHTQVAKNATNKNRYSSSENTKSNNMFVIRKTELLSIL